MRAGAVPFLILALAASGARAQSTAGAASPAGGALYGGVPSGEASPEVLDLSLAEAVDRGLQHNLALLLRQEGVRAARGARAEALGDLLPHLDGEISGTRQKVNLAAFGFTGFPGVPSVIGPFNVVDARLSVNESLLDLGALGKARAEAERLKAARYSLKDTQELVILVCGDLYLDAAADESRIAAARAEVETARALHELARDRKAAGLAPAVDALRAEVELEARQQQLIVAENRSARSKLVLARAVGLPLGQRFRLTDPVRYAPASEPGLEASLRQAYETRADWKSALAGVEAARQSRRSAVGERLPTVELHADYGAIGNDLGGARETYTLAAAVRVPLFEGGKARGKVLKADAELRQEQARLEDLRGRIDFEVRTAALDLEAARKRVKVADRALSLAREQLQQARDRFGAGVASNLEVVQAQEAVAAAQESYIASVLDHNKAKVALARAVGTGASSLAQYLKGES